jgi:hypothetical protein
MGAIGRLSRILRIHVQILEQTCLGEGRFVVDSGTTIAVSARSYFEVERAVDSGKLKEK